MDYKGKSVISFYNEDSIIVLTPNGKYYIGEFNTIIGGECTTLIVKDFLQLNIEKNEE